MSAVEPLIVPSSLPTRLTTTVLPVSADKSFTIETINKSYKHQYANLYFMRLTLLRPFVEARATKRWKDIAGNPTRIPRVLEVVKSQLCWVVGTVYMDMPLKPNVLEDIARDHSIPAPPPLKKFFSQEDSVMLEDESGRIRLVGERVSKALLVTGVIVAVLGVETPNGEFEVVDLCAAGLAPQTRSQAMEGASEKMNVDDLNAASFSSVSSSASDEWIAMVSGLDIGAESPSDAQIQMLVEYLTGEASGPEEQVSPSQISRLIIAGNSFAPMGAGGEHDGETKKPRRYGYDSATFSPHPTINFSALLLDLARTMPVHLLPGSSDPSGTILPQQSFPRAMFGAASAFSTFFCETNPTYIHIASGTEYEPPTETKSSSRTSISRTLLVNSGQPLNDMFKYLPSPPSTRLSLAESTLRWRHMAPTAPDTLWCHPFFAKEPFVILETPDLYVIGNQPRFQTRMVTDNPNEDGSGDKRCRVVLVPRFAETGVLVLVNLRTLGVKTLRFEVEGMTGGREMDEAGEKGR